MIRSNHYEAAFEAFLRDREIPFIAIDESKRTLIDEQRIKSADFVIVSPDHARLVVDIKGRKFPGGSVTHPRKVWQNWAEEDDIFGLQFWANHFGTSYRGVLVFAYHIVPPFTLADDVPDQFYFRERAYLFRAILAHEYQQVMKLRSPRWRTFHLPMADYRRLVRPVSELLYSPVVPPAAYATLSTKETT